MDAKVSWQKELHFVGVGNSGFQVQMDSHPGPGVGTSPMEMVTMALAGCTAMDVISILRKQKQDVTAFDVKVHAERRQEYPTVITDAVLEYVVVGHGIQEAGLRTAIDKSIQKYCPVHAMLKQAFPIHTRYLVFEAGADGQATLVLEGVYAE